MHSRQAKGVTLIELVIAVVIVSVAVGGVLLAFVQTAKHSADPQIDAQALAIAEAYLDEILAKPAGGAAGCSAGVPRSDCARVEDYDGIAGQTPTDQFGNPISELSDFAVSVSVGGSELGIGDVTVTVTATHLRTGNRVILRGHKAPGL